MQILVALIHVYFRTVKFTHTHNNSVHIRRVMYSKARDYSEASYLDCGRTPEVHYCACQQACAAAPELAKRIHDNSIGSCLAVAL